MIRGNYTFDALGRLFPVVNCGVKKRRRCENFNFSHLLFYKITETHWLIVDSFHNHLEIIYNKTKFEVFDQNNIQNPNFDYYVRVFSRDKSKLEKQHEKNIEESKKTRLNFFVVCPTYGCNSRCIYCYQQYDKLLDKTTMTEEELNSVLEYIQNQIDRIKIWYTLHWGGMAT